jgi:hypothetical protein
MGRPGGLELEHMRTDVAALFHIGAGKATRLALYTVRDPAFADLGLGA